MQNKWTASVTKKYENSEKQKLDNSKKIGLAMGVVGAILVTAGTIPMFFDNSNNLTGDISQQEEAVDPLVALLSGGNETNTSNQTNKKVQQTPTITPTPTIKPTQTPQTTKKPKHASAFSTSDEISKVTNKNTKKTDKKGKNFHNSSTIIGASNGQIKVQNGTHTASIDGNKINITNGTQSISIKNSQKTTIKPPIA